MDKKISSTLNKLELDNNIKILFAVESGSRLWNMESADSDYDVRFVYHHEHKEYLTRGRPKDVIEFDQPEDNIEYVGFDIYKFSNLYLKSNPNVIDWVRSPIEYYGDKPEIIMRFLDNEWNPGKLMHAYRGMAKNNYERYITNDSKVTWKKYLYVMRGLMAVKYIEVCHKLPKQDILKLINSVHSSDVISDDIKELLESAINKKKDASESNLCERQPLLEEWIDATFEEEIPDSFSKPSNEYLTMYDDWLFDLVSGFSVNP